MDKQFYSVKITMSNKTSEIIYNYVTEYSIEDGILQLATESPSKTRYIGIPIENIMYWEITPE